MLRAVLAAAAFAFSASVYPQAVTVQQVQLLAPQLLAFAGSSANLAALVSGMAQGLPVTLLAPTIDGQVQIATFTPPSIPDATGIARALESARASLISRGIAAPSAQQIAVALMGGALPTPIGAVQVPGVLTGTSNLAAVQVASQPAGFGGGGATTAGLPTVARQGNAVTLTGGAGQSSSFTIGGAALTDGELQQALFGASQLLAQLGIANPTPDQLRAALVGGPLSAANGTVTLQGLLQGRVRNTSDSPLFGTSNSPAVGTSNSPFFGTSNTPPTASGATATPSPDTGIPRGNTAEGANRAIRRGG
jgi:hypothetical protein